MPIGARYSHPDFVVMHPRRGLLILEVKDWSTKTIQRAEKQSWRARSSDSAGSAISCMRS